MKNKYSSFWLANKPRYIDSAWDRKSVERMMVMAEYRRAIANFVKIVTRKDIPVLFNTSTDHSFTTGNVVVISAEIFDESFDSTVGLALHEATHVVESDFDFFAPMILDIKIPPDIFSDANNLGYSKKKVLKRIKTLTNWVEDNRIDALQYQEAPGYRGYYWAMMNRYFNSESVVKGLKDKELFLKETLNNYFFRTINIMNPASDLDALKGLKEIHQLLDLPNILRLKNTEEAFYIAVELFRIMLKYVEANIKEEKEKKEKGEKGNNSGGGGLSDDTIPDDGNDEEDDEDEDGNESNDENEEDTKKILIKNAPVGGKPSDKHEEKDESEFDEVIDFNDLSKDQQEIIEAVTKQIEAQEQFIEGNTKKGAMDKEESARLDILGETGSSIEPVKFDPNEYSDKEGKTPPKSSYHRPDSYQPREYNVIVLRNINDAVFNSDIFPFRDNKPTYQADVNKGFALGARLGRKLQVRNEEKSTLYPRKESGKIEKRLLSELGFGNENIFQQTFIEKFAKAILHISIDISGSMNYGGKFNKCVSAACAIAKAASMVQNLDIVISLRGTTGDYAHMLPLIAIIYDSRKDKLSKIKKMFPYLTTPSATPEGLCYAAIQDEIVASSANIKSYFLNLCDGQPEFSGYSGAPAARHTCGEVEKMRGKGVNIMAYYIGAGSETPDNFKIMYGKDGKIINVDSIIELAKTLNALFISDEQKVIVNN